MKDGLHIKITDDLSLKTRNAEDLANAARYHNLFDASVGFQGRKIIRDWIQDEIAEYHENNLLFELDWPESPEELVELTLKEAEEDDAQ